MKTHPTLGTKLFGIVALVWGSLLLAQAGRIGLAFSNLGQTLNESSSFDFALEESVFAGGVSSYIIISIFFFAAGVGILARKQWGRKLYLGLSVYLIVQTLVSFLLFGAFINATNATIGVLFALLIFWYFNQANVATLFDVDTYKLQRERRRYLLSLLGLILFFIIGYLFLVFRYNLTPYWSQVRLNEVSYNQANFPSAIPTTELLLFDRYQITVPSSFNIELTNDNSASSFKSQVFASADKSVAFLINNEPVFESAAEVGRLFGYQDAFAFGRDLLEEKVGLIFLVLKKAMVAIYTESSFKQVSFGQWQGLLLELKSEQGNMMIYDYSLWDENKEALSILMFVKNNVLSEQEVMAIIASLRVRN